MFIFVRSRPAPWHLHANTIVASFANTTAGRKLDLPISSIAGFGAALSRSVRSAARRPDPPWLDYIIRQFKEPRRRLR